jgi:hypothetical protein
LPLVTGGQLKRAGVFGAMRESPHVAARGAAAQAYESCVRKRSANSGGKG